jgi:hypothetical protein
MTQFTGQATWLCTFIVKCDLPANLDVHSMEGAVAHSVAQALGALGLPGNVSAQLVATAGNITLLTENQGQDRGTSVSPTPVLPPQTQGNGPGNGNGNGPTTPTPPTQAPV